MTSDVEFTGDRGGVPGDTIRAVGSGRVAASVRCLRAPPMMVPRCRQRGRTLGAVSGRLRLREREIADELRGVDAKNLILVLDTGLVDDKLLLVMERADGSLAQHIAKEAPLSEREGRDQAKRGDGASRAPQCRGHPS
jgi:hypothetical protein